MTELTFVTYLTSPDDLDHSRITELDILTIGGEEFLVGTTRYDGILQSWAVAGGTLAAIDTLAFAGDLLPGVSGALTTLNQGFDTVLLTGGGAGGDLQVVPIATDGSFSAATELGTTAPIRGGFQPEVTVTLGSGAQVVYGGVVGAVGIGRLDFDPDGVLTGQNVLAAPSGTATAQISAIVSAEVSGTTYLLSTSSSGNLVTNWVVSPDGSLTEAVSLGTNDGLWVSAPTAMAVANVGGSTYAVLAAAGSGTLSVLEVAMDGSLIIREHILDTRDTRFAGVTTLDTLTHAGQTYVIAGGADDGLTIFVLLEGGQLVARATIEDTVDMGLDNVSAITARGRGDGLDIFVASSSEPGITQLRFDAGPAGVTTTAVLAGGLLAGTAGADILQGLAGNDVIEAGAGDDIIRDGAGSDMLSGGAGADVFILSQDGELDTITDFTVGEDSIDLSLWPFLRDISQLTITIRSDGMQISYGSETLIVQSADGQPIDYRNLQTSDLIGATRLPQNIEPGYPGPARPPISLDPPAVPGEQGGPNDPLAGAQVLAAGNIDVLRDALGGGTAPDTPVIAGGGGADAIAGGVENEVILAGAGDDTITGGAGNDTLLGRDGDDTLRGEDDADILLGGDGNDLLIGGNGQDLLRGGDGDDRLEGGAGDDLLFGDAGADTFVFNGGNDRISDFEQGLDQITLDASLWGGLTSASDVLFVYGSIDGTQTTIDLGDGNILTIDNISDYSMLADDIILF
ncbi:calcium-binding protein [Cognatiyoonia sp. IB215182]|uniref:calcium-binding protein n=1 Tax=Cognatiyoonia sp. IB215182 TaxID=3097353 RepID=UPI002A161582|nr:calcium-binding protein [Cognatiyoonia sp. IB215182]MDX8354570.1 calcium-binding protein [Cognatiyoonia sp. IB215182]